MKQEKKIIKEEKKQYFITKEQFEKLTDILQEIEYGTDMIHDIAVNNNERNYIENFSEITYDLGQANKRIEDVIFEIHKLIYRINEQNKSK
jgi:hypothetical protein